MINNRRESITAAMLSCIARCLSVCRSVTCMEPCRNNWRFIQHVFRGLHRTSGFIADEVFAQVTMSVTGSCIYHEWHWTAVTCQVYPTSCFH